MNPEDNNPLTNTGMPDLGIPATPTDLGGSMAGQPVVNSPLTDIPSGFSTNPADAISQDMVSGVEEQSAPAIEEPLVPAGPVPGSIGSVTSVPPASPTDQPSSTEQATTPVNQVDPIPAPATATPQPQAAYNPFAQQPANPTNEAPAPAPAPTSAGMPGLGGAPAPSAPTMAPPVQPTNAPKAKANAKFTPVTILLAVVAGVAIIVSIVLAIMLMKAENSKEIVYAPLTPTEGTSASSEQVLTCSRSSDFSYLIGYDHEVMGDQLVTLNYDNGSLVSLSLDNTATFDSEDDANVAKDNYANAQTVWETLVSNFETDGSTMKTTTTVSDDEELSSSDASAVIYGDESNTDLSLSAVQANYEAQGYTCSLNQ